MSLYATQFMTLAERIKSEEYKGDNTLFSQIYEMAEEIVLRKGDTLFTNEFDKLKNIISTTKPFVMDLDHRVNELHAWTDLMKRALNENIVEYLSEELKAELCSRAGEFDDGVDIFVFENIHNLTATQVCQIYLAQTIGFYYIIDEGMEFEFNGVFEAFK